MRNLKKILALVLALMMAVSLMATASAAFTDSASVNASYSEAVKVTSGLDIFRGRDTGAFDPTATISRAEVAAMAYRMYTMDTDEDQVKLYEDYNKFSDVTSDKWFAGQVNYCANGLYVLGYPDGTFKPDDDVTGYQVLAIVLRMLGYDKNGEFAGPGWEIRTATIAQQIGITAGINTTTLGSAATRQEVAQMLFNALNAPMVQYVAGMYTPIVLADKGTLVDPQYTNTYDADVYQTLFYKNWKVLGTADTTDKYGRPAKDYLRDTNGDYYLSIAETTVSETDDTADRYYDYAVKTIADPVATYYTKMTECDLAEAVNGGKTMQNVDIYANGLSVSVKDETLDALHTTHTAGTNPSTVGAQGRTMEVYKTANVGGVPSWTIVYIDNFLAKIDKVNEATYDTNGHVWSSASVDATVGLKDAANSGFNVSFKVATDAGYKAGDLILVNTWGMNAGGVIRTHVENLTSGAGMIVDSDADFCVENAAGADIVPAVEVAGTPTTQVVTVQGTTGSAATKDGIVADGVTYKAANVYQEPITLNGYYQMTGASVTNKGINNNMIGQTYTLVLDTNKNIVGMVAGGTTSEIGVVLEGELVRAGTNRYVYEASLYMSDNTTRTVSFVDNSNGLNYFAKDASFTDNTDLKFLQNDALVKISPVTMDGNSYYIVADADVQANANESDKKVATGVHDTLDKGGTVYGLNDNSVVFVALYTMDYSAVAGSNQGAMKRTGYHAYTGFKTIPTVDATGAGMDMIVETLAGDNAAAIRAAGTNGYNIKAVAQYAVDDSVLILGEGVTYQTYSTYDVVKNGEKTTVNVSNVNSTVNTDADTLKNALQLAVFSGNDGAGNYDSVVAASVPTAHPINGKLAKAFTTSGSVSYAAGVLTIDDDANGTADGYLTVADNCVVKIVNVDTRTVYDGTLGQIAQYSTGVNANRRNAFAFELDANGYVSYLYIID